jgi:murein DD-endopeptidase MepM/ murein hydrolase activator NlpD
MSDYIGAHRKKEYGRGRFGLSFVFASVLCLSGSVIGIHSMRSMQQILPIPTEREDFHASRSKYVPLVEAPVLVQHMEIPWAMPIERYAMTSCYAMRWGRMHYGLDMAAPQGREIVAVGDGTVVSSGWTYQGFGKSVVIKHTGGWYTFYAHAYKLRVNVGQRVSAGQVIALVGSTGHSTGPHLHFGVFRHKFGNWVNPKYWLIKRGLPVDEC